MSQTPPNFLAVRWRRHAAPLAVLGGGLVGSAARSLVFLLFDAGPTEFPVATFFVNLVGSFLLALFLVRRQRSLASAVSLQFWAIGGLGSFTTFSGFSVEVFGLIDAGAMATATAYVAASIIGSLVAAVLGGRIGRVTP